MMQLGRSKVGPDEKYSLPGAEFIKMVLPTESGLFRMDSLANEAPGT